MSALQNAALAYAAAGMPVLPLEGKIPRNRGGLTNASTDVAQVAEWWRRWPSANVGLVTGSASGYVVLDVDVGAGFRSLAELERRHGKIRTAQVLTGSGGQHLWFRCPVEPLRNSVSAIGKGLDVRGDGGYVVAPPSLHETGNPYKWTRDLEYVTECPAWLLEDAHSQRNGSAPVVGSVIVEGERDNTLTSLAGSMRRRGMGEAEILAALRVTNEERCRPPKPDADLRRIAGSVSRYAPSVEEHPAEGGDAPDAFGLVAVDWGPILENGVPELEYISAPYLPNRKRIWAVGPAESGKSIWAAFKASALTRAGIAVAYVSQENGLEEEVRRFMRLTPDYRNLRLFVDQGLDLALPEHIAALVQASEGTGLTVIDTLSACWSGDEDSNSAIAAFDRDVLTRLVRETGTSPLVLDHTGNPQPFGTRKGVSAPRGASAKGQKADFLLEFKTTGDSEFTIHHGKARGARKQQPQTFRVVDTDDEGLDLIEVASSADERAEEIADGLVEAIRGAPSGFLITKEMREAGKQLGAGTEVTNAAMDLLKSEEPPRISVAPEVVQTGGGRQNAKVWRPVFGHEGGGA